MKRLILPLICILIYGCGKEPDLVPNEPISTMLREADFLKQSDSDVTVRGKIELRNNLGIYITDLNPSGKLEIVVNGSPIISHSLKLVTDLNFSQDSLAPHNVTNLYFISDPGYTIAGALFDQPPVFVRVVTEFNINGGLPCHDTINLIREWNIYKNYHR